MLGITQIMTMWVLVHSVISVLRKQLRIKMAECITHKTEAELRRCFSFLVQANRLKPTVTFQYLPEGIITIKGNKIGCDISTLATKTDVYARDVVLNDKIDANVASINSQINTHNTGIANLTSNKANSTDVYTKVELQDNPTIFDYFAK